MGFAGKFVDRVYRRTTAALPQRISAQLDLMRPSYLHGWGGPMNGQRKRQGLMRMIFKQVPFDVVIETGTFRGGTTRWLHDMSGLPVHSVETETRFYLYAKTFCSYSPDIDIRQEDSREFLKKMIPTIKDKTTFFYLDAHWNTDVPRYEELEMITEAFERSVIVVDDFKVPGDTGYGYTNYGGSPLDESYLPDLNGWELFYPAIPSETETGARRGCAIFASPALAGELAKIPILRPSDTLSRPAAS